jgi:hypothetical protein
MQKQISFNCFETDFNISTEVRTIPIQHGLTKTRTENKRVA